MQTGFHLAQLGVFAADTEGVHPPQFLEAAREGILADRAISRKCDLDL